MASSGSSRSGLLTAGGILSIIGGAFEVIGGGIVVALIMSPGLRRMLLPPIPMPLLPGDWYEHFIPVMPTWLIIVGVPLLVLGIVAIIGGDSALRRKNFGLSLAGAICALPSHILGILAIIFVSLSKKEFEAKE
jgi:hypothetical protein